SDDAPHAVELRGKSEVPAIGQGFESLSDPRLGVAVPPCAGISVGQDAEVKWLESSGSDLARLVQARLGILKTSCGVLLRKSPAEVNASPGMPKGHGHFVGQPERLARGALNLLRPSQPDVHQGCPIAQG